MDIRATRMANIEALASRYQYTKDFCSQAGIKPSYLSQLRSEVKNLGNNLAREIEERLELPRFWLDQQHDAPAGEKQQVPPDAMSVAMVLESISDSNLRDSLKRTIFAAAQAQVGQVAPAPVAAPQPQSFQFTHGTPREQGTRSSVPDSSSENDRHGSGTNG